MFAEIFQNMDCMDKFIRLIGIIYYVLYFLYIYCAFFGLFKHSLGL